ncbi:thermonuclease family protein [Oxalobacteraceae bacterium R-40]|uniref:Thermonuclease family protein n=1 Tax=Keguizhuia sedimenti TaxID=3064264 RepID=A0ABU1BQV9_9BURK|nr:thermonuclease family protein [Oxalobacteraceae bacterium R-40]
MQRGKPLVRRLLAAFSLMAVQWTCASQEFSSFAFVQEDGSLKVAGRHVQLYGIYIPPTEQTCYTFIRPAPCGPRAVLALDFKISGDFIHCIPRAENADGSIIASCSLDNEDLSIWMLQRGWAVARADAPFEYGALERIAQSKGIGIWGIPIDTFPHPGLRK